MPFFGDRYGEIWMPEICRYISMSTAIARIYTTEGFVLAADGRKIRSDTGEVLSDSEQKIFGIEQRGRRLGYTTAGAVILTHKDTDEVLFNYLEAATVAIAMLATEQHKSLWHYASAVAENIAGSAETAGQISNDYDATVEGAETHISIDGYYGTHPKRVTMRFVNHIHHPLETEVSPNELHPGLVIGYGSLEVFSMVNARDPRFAEYRVDVKDPQRVTLSEGIQLARNMVAAHTDPEAKKLNPERWAATGGTTRVATITFSHGFQWAD